MGCTTPQTSMFGVLCTPSPTPHVCKAPHHLHPMSAKHPTIYTPCLQSTPPSTPHVCKAPHHLHPMSAKHNVKNTPCLQSTTSKTPHISTASRQFVVLPPHLEMGWCHVVHQWKWGVDFVVMKYFHGDERRQHPSTFSQNSFGAFAPHHLRVISSINRP